MTVKHRFPRRSVLRMFYEAHDNIAGGNQVMLDLLFGPNPITDDELRQLIEKRPATYGRFAGYLGKRAS